MSHQIKYAAVVLTVVGGLIYWVTLSNNNSDSPLNTITEQQFIELQSGPMTISVIESGAIKARDQVIIKNELEGQTNILWLIDEGKQVKQGDLLIEMDGSELDEKLVNQQIKVKNAEAAFIRVRENLKVVNSQNISDIEDIQLVLSFAKIDLEKYLRGEYPNELNQVKAKITLTEEEFTRAEEKLKWSRRLFEEKVISHTELQADDFGLKKASLDRRFAQENLKLLQNFDHPRKVAELQSQIKQTKRAEERTRYKASADKVQAEAELLAKESEKRREQIKLDKINAQIQKTRIFAPTDGLVIYATTAKASWRGNIVPLDIGQTVKQRQELIYLPQTDSMLIELKVHESSLNKISVGLPARVTVDVLTGKSFSGKVASISPLPDAASLWVNPDLKVYNTIIHLDESSLNQGLRTGMSCSVEIIFKKIPNAMMLPLQSIVQIDGLPTVYVRTANGLKPKTIQTGLDNNHQINVISGLKAGDEVLLTPPLEFAVFN